MNRTEQRLADLERLVAGQADELQRLRAEAFVLRTLEEAALDRSGYGGSRPADLRAPRSRHLRLVGGSS